MSGNIAVSDCDDGTILFRTLKECKAKLWITLTPFGTGFDKAAITNIGRATIKECRSLTAESPTIERRRALYS